MFKEYETIIYQKYLTGQTSNQKCDRYEEIIRYFLAGMSDSAPKLVILSPKGQVSEFFRSDFAQPKCTEI